jgi:hypothetical protein
LDYFREKVKEAGFPGILFQFVGRGSENPICWEVNMSGNDINEIVSLLGLNMLQCIIWLETGLWITSGRTIALS